MRSRWNIALIVASLGCAGCSLFPQRAALEVRPVAPRQEVPVNGELAHGDVLFQRGETALALEAYRRAARNDPGDARAYNGQAVCYAMLGRYDLSQRNFELALARSPRDAKIYRNLARSLESQGKRDEARRVLAQMEAMEQPEQRLADARDRAVAITPVAPDRPPLAVLAASGDRPSAMLPPQAALHIERLSLEEALLKTLPAPPGSRPPQLKPRLVVRIPQAAPQPSLRAAPAAAPPLSSRRASPRVRTLFSGLQHRLVTRIRDMTGQEPFLPSRPPSRVRSAQVGQGETAVIAFVRCMPVLALAARPPQCGQDRG